MVKISENITKFAFNLEEIAMLFGVTLDSKQSDDVKGILVLAPVANQIRNMILANKPVPDSLWDVLLTLAEHIESIRYSEIDESSE